MTRSAVRWCSKEDHSTVPGPQSGMLGVIEAAGGVVPAGELRRRGGLARPGEGVQQHHRLGRRTPGPAPAASHPGRRTPHPAAAAARPPPHRRRARCGGVQPDHRRRALRRAQQHQRRGLIDDRDGPVLQLDRGRADLPDRVGGQRPAGRGRGLAQRPPGQQVRVQVRHELGRGHDVHVVPHRHHARHARVGDLGGQRPVRPDPRVHIPRQPALAWRPGRAARAGLARRAGRAPRRRRTGTRSAPAPAPRCRSAAARGSARRPAAGSPRCPGPRTAGSRAAPAAPARPPTPRTRRRHATPPPPACCRRRAGPSGSMPRSARSSQVPCPSKCTT